MYLVTKSVTDMSFDTTNLRLGQNKVDGVDFISELPCYLSNVSEITSADGSTAIIGYLLGNGNSGYKVYITEQQVSIKDCSLCKWAMGDNFSEMSKSDTKRAIEKLSDLLHLPIDKADVTRLDFANNIITQHPTAVYLNHLGELSRYKRLVQPSTIYYQQANIEFVIYDKIREQRQNGAYIPELYQNRNVLRLEQRYKKRVSSRLGNVVGSMLYDDGFCNLLLKNWADTYFSIKKIGDKVLNFNDMKSIKDLYKMGVLALMQQAGGEVEMLNQIKEQQLMGELTKKQASDLRKVVREAGKVDNKLIVPNTSIVELDEKVKRAVRVFR